MFDERDLIVTIFSIAVICIVNILHPAGDAGNLGYVGLDVVFEIGHAVVVVVCGDNRGTSTCR